MKTYQQKLIAILCLLAVFSCPLAAQDEADHLAVLKNPEASLFEKQNACRGLARVATAEAVPVLAGLLGDEQLSHMARMALEPLPHPSADAALREALATVKGGPLLGVIASIGVRGDEQAIPALAGLLANNDDALACAAARALGDIGAVEAARALQSALGEKKLSPGRIQSLYEGLFRCAEALTRNGETEPARQIYDAISAIDAAPHQVRAAALRGAVLTRGKEGLPLVLDALRGDDYGTFAAAIRIAMELEGTETTGALTSVLADLPAERQTVAIDALGERDDPGCGPALLSLLDKAGPTVQIALVKTLTRLAHEPALPALVKLSLASDDEVATFARESLAGFPGQAADDAIVSLLAGDDSATRLLGIELIGQRDTGLALPVLLKTAAIDSDENVRVAALKILRDRAGIGELVALIDILLGTDSIAAIQAAAHALVAVVARQPADGGDILIEKAIYGDSENRKSADVTEKVAALVQAGATSIEASNSTFGDPARGLPKQLTIHYRVDGAPARKTVPERESLELASPEAPAALVDPLLAAFEKATGAARIALLRVLRSVGGTKAFEAVRSAAADSDPAIRQEGQRALCEWPSADALPAIRELAVNPPDAALRDLALRGWLRLIPLQDATAEQKLDQVKQALPLAERTPEKWAVLGALREIPLVGALEMAVPLLDNPEIAEQACVTAVEISGKIADKHPGEVHAAMKKVAGLTEDKRLANQAAKIARETRGK